MNPFRGRGGGACPLLSSFPPSRAGCPPAFPDKEGLRSTPRVVPTPMAVKTEVSLCLGPLGSPEPKDKGLTIWAL